MKSTLQLQLDNDYELLRVAHLKKAENVAPVITLPSKPSNALRLTTLIPASLQQTANWDLNWFHHYE